MLVYQKQSVVYCRIGNRLSVARKIVFIYRRALFESYRNVAQPHGFGGVVRLWPGNARGCNGYVAVPLVYKPHSHLIGSFAGYRARRFYGHLLHAEALYATGVVLLVFIVIMGVIIGVIDLGAGKLVELLVS